MALRNRTALPTINNQENRVNLKSDLALPDFNKRAALGEISNKVNTLRGTAAIDRASLLTRGKKKAPVQQTVKPIEKIAEKPPVQIVKPVIKQKIKAEIKTPSAISIPKKVESFSTDLLGIEDVDGEDDDKLILVSMYCKDIYQYLRSLEVKYPIMKGYLKGQEISPKMRSVLINWLVEVHQQFHLLQETLYLTVAIIDRFLQSFRSTDKKTLQLVGVTAMFIASKYEEMHSPDINDFVYITDNAYSKEEILKMELVVIKTLDFSFGRPFPLHFLRRYSKIGKAQPVHHMMAKYFLEESLIHYEMCHYAPSLIAAAALYLAFLIIGNEETEGKLIWTSTLAYYSTYKKEDILPVVREIANIIVNIDSCRYQAVRKKYVLPKYMKISIRPELKSPTMRNLVQAEN